MAGVERADRLHICLSVQCGPGRSSLRENVEWLTRLLRIGCNAKSTVQSNRTGTSTIRLMTKGMRILGEHVP